MLDLALEGAVDGSHNVVDVDLYLQLLQLLR